MATVTRPSEAALSEAPPRAAWWAQALVLLGCAGLTWAARGAGNVVRGVPGHTGLLWLPPAFLAAGLLRRPWAPVATVAIGGSAWAVTTGHGVLSVADDVAAGFVLSALVLCGLCVRALVPALIAGGAAHLAKFAAHVAIGAATGQVGGYLRLGVVPVAALHLAFGLGAGFLGWVALRAAVREPSRLRP